MDKWIKAAGELLNNTIQLEKKKENSNSRKNKIEILEMDELYSKYYDNKKKEQKESKYGLLLTETEIKLLHLK